LDNLHPTIDFTDLIAQRTRDFTGRSWVFERIGDWLDNTAEPLYFISGGPGSGKSSISCRLAQFSMGSAAFAHPRLAQGSIVFAQFCQARRDRTLDPRSLVTSLGLQIARHIPAFAGELANIGSQTVNLSGSVQVEKMEGGLAGGVVIKNLNIGELSARVAFNQIVRTPLEKVQAAAPPENDIVILIDGLDEALSYADQHTIVHLLGDVLNDLPPGLRFIVAGRPDKRIRDRIGDPNLDLIAKAPPDNTDLEDYLVARLAGSAAASDKLIGDIAAQSGGNFLYAQHVADGIIERNLDPAADDWKLPADLNEIYEQFCGRELEKSDRDWSRIYRPMLSALAVAHEPGLTGAHLRGTTGARASNVSDALTVIGQYLQPPGIGDGPFQIYHESFREFLLDRKVFPDEANLELAKFLLESNDQAWDVCDDAYALRFTPTHLADAIDGQDRKRDRANLLKLLDLVSDPEFQAAVERVTGDLAGLRDQLHRTLQIAVLDPLPTSASVTVQAALNMVLFEQEFLQPEALFVLARGGKLEQALARLRMLGADSQWLLATQLALVWEAGLPNTKVTQDVLAAGMDDPELGILACRMAGQPVEAGALPPPPDPTLVAAILQTMGGDISDEGLAEVLLGGGVNVVTGIERMGDEAPLYLAEAHAPHLVAAALVPEWKSEATERLQDYIQLHAGNKYVFYRNRSLFAILKEALKHPDDEWLRALLPMLCASSLLSGERFAEFLPMALDAVAAKSGDADAGRFEQRAQRIAERAEAVVVERTGDPWSRVLRELAALGECRRLAMHDADRARANIEQAMSLKKGYAGFRAPSLAFVAESVAVVNADGDQNVEGVMRASLKAAHNIQDPYFCLETTSRVNALINRLQAAAGDVSEVIDQLVHRPESPEFQALHKVGETFPERIPGPQKLELPPEFETANTIAKLSDIFWTSVDELARINGRAPGTEQDVLEDDVKTVRIPDPDFRPWLATQLSAAVLADDALTDKKKSRLIQQLVPVAAPNRTCLDTVLARLVLVSSDVDSNIVGEAKRLAGLAGKAQAPSQTPAGRGLNVDPVIHYTRVPGPG
jgi:hypothetical protein